jgi:hypothetical protein
MLTLVLLGLLLGCRFCKVNAIVFKFPPSATQQQRDEIDLAVKDALTLARLVAIASVPCEEVTRPPPTFILSQTSTTHLSQSFLRYFQPQDYLFVQRMFRTVANIPLDRQFDPFNVAEYLASMAKNAQIHPKFAELTISLGNHPDVRDRDRGRSCNDGKLGAQTTYLPAQYGDRALMAICRPSLEFYYALQDIEHPPSWALTAPGGKPEEGFGCDGLLDRDTSYMLSPGAVILHELMHWPCLLQDIPGYASLAQRTTHGYSKILDFPGPSPPDGYGPFNSAVIRNLPISAFTGSSQAIRNADNFVWYAVDKYWS